MFILVILVLFSSSGWADLAQTSPKLSEHVPRRSQNAGTKLIIFCGVQEGSKPFEFEWNQNDHALVGDHLKYQIDNQDDTSHLTISDLDQSDSANYSCIVRNDFGFDSQTTILLVKGLIYSPLILDSQPICGA